MKILAAMFELGDVYTTYNAERLIPKNEALLALMRHNSCDWGDLSDDDKKINFIALEFGDRLFSKYKTKNGIDFYIITEADRSVTTILLPTEY